MTGSYQPETTTASQSSLRESVKSLASLPGVYRMYDQQERLLYVGKAKNLHKRVQSYFRLHHDSSKTAAMMKQVHMLDTTVTHSESEALLLEQNLIKQYRPKYNVLLRDDKSYPFLFLSNHQDFPYLAFKRSNKVSKGRLFGPYTNSYAVRSALHLLQKVFRLRQCNDAFFRNRSRPCLQHQIGRCSAPCVGLISNTEYQRDVNLAIHSIQGKNNYVIEQLQQEMKNHAGVLDFEKAANIRDKIATLRQIQEHQAVSQQTGDADVIAVSLNDLGCCLHHLLIRSGKVIGSFNRFPSIRLETTEAEVIEQYIVQYYLLSETITNYPQVIISNHQLESPTMLEHMLQQQKKLRIQCLHHVRSERASWLRLAITNAEQGLQTKVNTKRSNYGRLQKLTEALNLQEIPQRLECFDISHTFGEATYASCVVFDQAGPAKASYRLFSIQSTSDGDDYAAMREAIERRFATNKDRQLPDLLCIDGGKGQMSSALEQLKELDTAGMAVLGIAKGPGRKPGLEKLFFTRVGNKEKPAEITLYQDSSALHLIQHIRDEAHRFAITHHRKKRAKTRKRSLLEDIPSVGAARRQKLISHFGGRKGVLNASITDLAKVKGISDQLAQQIYQHIRSVANTRILK